MLRARSSHFARISISPLGVTRRERSRPLSRLRIVPLLASIAGFAAALALLAGAPAVRRSRSGSSRARSSASCWASRSPARGSRCWSVAPSGHWPAGRASCSRRAGSPTTRAARSGAIARRRAGCLRGKRLLLGRGIRVGGFRPARHDAAACRDARRRVPTQPGRTAPAELAARLAAQDGVRAVGMVRVGQATTRDGTVINAWVADCPAIAVLLPAAAPCGPRTLYGVDDATGLQFAGPAAEPGPEIPIGSGTFAPPATLGIPESVQPLPADESIRGQVDVLLTPDLLPDGGAPFAVTRFLVATDAATATVERARTAVEAAFPTARAWTVEDYARAGARAARRAGADRRDGPDRRAPRRRLQPRDRGRRRHLRTAPAAGAAAPLGPARFGSFRSWRCSRRPCRCSS